MEYSFALTLFRRGCKILASLDLEKDNFHDKKEVMVSESLEEGLGFFQEWNIEVERRQRRKKQRADKNLRDTGLTAEEEMKIIVKKTLNLIHRELDGRFTCLHNDWFLSNIKGLCYHANRNFGQITAAFIRASQETHSVQRHFKLRTRTNKHGAHGLYYTFPLVLQLQDGSFLKHERIQEIVFFLNLGRGHLLIHRYIRNIVIVQLLNFGYGRYLQSFPIYG
uniref:Uncharacterized protein n=1 Tax=Timema poppense TaxID=170557 RepID=A0A7R9D5J1_TIMPO|nr:unnamed protein product [Timema poppensis]